MIRIPSDVLYPIMGPDYIEEDFTEIILDKKFLRRKNVQNTTDLKNYQESLKAKNKTAWLIGGYLEHRSLYQSSLFIEEGTEPRNIHLGVDIWGPSASPIYAPLDGRVHSFAYNAPKLDYGYTTILEHQYLGQYFYVLYGHLSKKYFASLKVGKLIRQGETFGTFGTENENGGWIPHVHVQMILDMENKSGDYPGVCSASRLDYYRHNCPDVNMIIKKAP